MIALAAFLAAAGIEVKLSVGDSELAEKRCAERDNLCICRCVICAEALNSELMMLAKSSCLRLFIAEVRRDIINLERKPLCVERVFDE